MSYFAWSQISHYPANGGFYSSLIFPEDNPTLPPGFEQIGDQLFITEEEVVSGIYDLYLHVQQTNSANGITDICYSSIHTEIEVVRSPEVNSRYLECLSEGDSIFLNSLVTRFGSQGGLYYVDGQLVDEGIFKPTESGCYTLTFDPDICDFDEVSTDFLVSFNAKPQLEYVSDVSGPICQDGGTYEAIIARTSEGSAPNLSITPSDSSANFSISGDISIEDVTVSFDGPASAGGIDYLICLEETTEIPLPCDTFDLSNVESLCQYQMFDINSL